MRYNVLLLLSCGHTRLLKSTRITPELAWCNECDDAHAVVDSVSTQPEVRKDNGHAY